ncbi:unnamed protein product [Phytophthora lilii]|uniref:Unnamed protein product n=1 Tax=Phytophthora lilii TaxID=2077276 RepID=A0A9W6WQS8_9STRA|nr:unnamed protein product [Phytophthora lilii]
MTASEDTEPQEEYRQAFLRMGFGHYSEGVDPEEIIRTCLSHEEIKKELDAKHDEDMERIAILRDQLQILQNVTNETVNVDDMTGIENALMSSIEEMMKLVRESQHDSDSPSNHLPREEPQSPSDAGPTTTEGESSSTSKAIAKLDVVSADHFTSPFNIRITSKPKEPCYVLGMNSAQAAAKPADDGKGKP